MRYWLVKSDSEEYAWQDLVKEKRCRWDGVRNFQARNHLEAMQVGDKTLFYHSGASKEVVGIARVARAAYRDPTADEERWLAVDLQPLRTLPQQVSLATMRGVPALAGMALLKQSRLSVVPLTAAEFRTIVKLGRD